MSILIFCITNMIKNEKIHQKLFNGFLATDIIYYILNNIVEHLNITLIIIMIILEVIALLLLILSIYFYVIDKKKK